MSDTKKRALVVRAFNDAGTGESFAKGDTPLIEAGAYGNYVAAGLVEPAPRVSTAPTPRRAARKAKPAAPKPAPAPADDIAPAPDA